MPRKEIDRLRLQQMRALDKNRALCNRFESIALRHGLIIEALSEEDKAKMSEEQRDVHNKWYEAPNSKGTYDVKKIPMDTKTRKSLEKICTQLKKQNDYYQTVEQQTTAYIVAKKKELDTELKQVLNLRSFADKFKEVDAITAYEKKIESLNIELQNLRGNKPSEISIEKGDGLIQEVSDIQMRKSNEEERKTEKSKEQLIIKEAIRSHEEQISTLKKEFIKNNPQLEKTATNRIRVLLKELKGNNSDKEIQIMSNRLKTSLELYGSAGHFNSLMHLVIKNDDAFKANVIRHISNFFTVKNGKTLPPYVLEQVMNSLQQDPESFKNAYSQSKVSAIAVFLERPFETEQETKDKSKIKTLFADLSINFTDEQVNKIYDAKKAHDAQVKLQQEELAKQEALKQKALEQKALEQKALEQKALEQKALEQKALEQKALEQEALEQKALEQKALEQEALKQAASELAPSKQPKPAPSPSLHVQHPQTNTKLTDWGKIVDNYNKSDYKKNVKHLLKDPPENNKEPLLFENTKAAGVFFNEQARENLSFFSKELNRKGEPTGNYVFSCGTGLSFSGTLDVIIKELEKAQEQSPEHKEAYKKALCTVRTVMFREEVHSEPSKLPEPVKSKICCKFP